MVSRAWRQTYPGLIPAQAIERHEKGVAERAQRWQRAAREGQYYWIVLEDECIVGVASAVPARDDDAPAALELAMCYLLDVAKGSGIADHLLHVTIGDSPAYLWVAEGNERAAAFFRRHGFGPTGRSRDNGGYRCVMLSRG